MTYLKLAIILVVLLCFALAFWMRTDPIYSLPIMGIGGQLLGMIFPELGRKKVIDTTGEEK